MKKFLLLLFLLSYSLFSDVIKPKNILVLHSYHKSMSWVSNIDKAIYDVLKPQKNNHILHIEYMDTKRTLSKKYLDDLKEFYQIKYKDVKFDLILTSDDNAYDFLEKNRNTIFGNIPTVFAGINDIEKIQSSSLDNITGVVEKIEAKKTIDIALKLFPKTKNIFIINDYTKTGQTWQKKIKFQLAEMSNNINITYSENLPFEKLQKQLTQLKDDTLVLLGVYFKDKNNVYFTYEKIGTLLAESSNSAVFCLLEFNLKKNVLGGNLISGYSQGETMSLLAKEILAGESPKNISIKLANTNRYIFDERALKKYNISIKKLPKNSIILNKTIPFYEKHKVVIINSSFIILFLLIIITTLLINIKKRKEMEKELLNSQNKINKINKSLEIKVENKTKKIRVENALKKLYLDTAEVLLIVLDKNGDVTMLNKKGCELLEIKEEDILNKNWFDLDFLPLEIRTKQKEYFENLIKTQSSSIDKHCEHTLISKNKKEILFTWTNTLLEIDNKIVGIISSALDITEKAEQEKILFMQSKITAVEEILTNISHHWRQPLASIAGQLATIKLSTELEEEIPSEEMLTYVNNMYIQCEYLSNTIDNFRNFFMADSMIIEKINIKNTITKAQRLIEDTFKDNKIKIIKNLQNCEININEATFIDAILNILNNAKDAIILNDIEENNRYLFIDLKKDEKELTLNIFDNGGGIKEEALNKVFEPYYTTKHKATGTGIGLYMTNQIITKHLNGIIKADNINYEFEQKKFSGAIFTITLPIS